MTGSAPPAASGRAYLRAGLPAAYADSDFTVRFVGSLEEQLDPIVATLDSLVDLVSAPTAPAHVLRLVGSWLGLVIDEDLPVAAARELVRHAPELGRRRGTAAGLRLLLDLSFPALELEIDDGGCVTIGDAMPAPRTRRHAFVVRSRRPLDANQREAITRVLDRERPAHVTYELVDSTRPAGVGR
jgi:phage tail-like protein